MSIFIYEWLLTDMKVVPSNVNSLYICMYGLISLRVCDPVKAIFFQGHTEIAFIGCSNRLSHLIV